MDDDWDVEALLEAPYKRQNADRTQSDDSSENDKRKKNKKKKHNSREKESHKVQIHSQDEFKNRRKHSYSKERRSPIRTKNHHDTYDNLRAHQLRSRSRSPERRKAYANYHRNKVGSYGRNWHSGQRYYHKRYNREDYRHERDDYRRDREESRHDREEYRRRSRSRSRDDKNSNKEKKSPSLSPKKEIKSHDSADEFAKPARLHRNPDLTPEERDMRTVFCMQLSQRVRARDLEEFFSPVGKVQDVRIILDNKTRRSKGIAYVEFQDTYSVSLAMGLSGKKLLGVPILVQLTQAEKNRAAASVMSMQRNIGPMKLYVGSLHFNITEDMLKGIFEPFGKIDRIELIKDSESGRSKGYGFITFRDSDSAKKALEQLNGFELAGRPMKIGTVTDRIDFTQGPSYLDTEEMDRAGIDLGATGRLQLMAKLAEGTGLKLPQAAVNALQMTAQAAASPMAGNPTVSVASQCFMLSNMFDPAKEASINWDEDIRNDVIEECRNHGGALHVYVDKNSSAGNVYVKCPSLTAAAASVTALHGRYFAGRVIVAAYVPIVNYHMLFPDSANATVAL